MDSFSSNFLNILKLCSSLSGSIKKFVKLMRVTFFFKSKTGQGSLAERLSFLSVDWRIWNFFVQKNFKYVSQLIETTAAQRESLAQFLIWKKKLHASIWRIFWLSRKENYTISKCSKSSKKKNPSPESLNWNPQCKKEFGTNLKNLIQDLKAWWTIFYLKKTLLNWSSAMIT